MGKCIEDLNAKKLAEATRALAYKRAGGSAGEKTYQSPRAVLRP